jgi:hypothetical protein
MLKEISNSTFNEWMAFYSIVDEDEKNAIEKAKG